MSQIEQVKEATDIIEIINERVPLQRSGRNYRANCPFHGEKTPSFFVNDQIQRYKCFGCGETGDAFTFLEKYEGMSFAEALQYLADRAGITLEKISRTKEDDERDQLYEILNLAKEYYHYLLQKHEIGAGAREYLKDRGITSDSIKLFQLGYSHHSWDSLAKYLHKKKKYSFDLLEKAGLVIKGRKGGYYDRFRGRVMFPLTDHRGKVVGFSGRTLDPEAKTAKYINSPETSLYHKAQLLYGYSQMRQAIREKKSVVVTEGEMDVISSVQAHVGNVVALKGSALTEQQGRLLNRLVEKVLLALDTDSAGVEATKRAIEVSKKFEYELRVVMLPEGKDPDDLARNKPDVWRKAVKESVSVPDFFLTVLQKQHDISTPEGQRGLMAEIAPVLQGLQHAVERDFYVKKVAKVLGVRESVVREDMRKVDARKRVEGSSNKPAAPEILPTSTEHVTLDQHQHALLSLVLLHDEQVAVKLSQLPVDKMETGLFKTLLESMQQFIKDKDGFTLQKWAQSLAGDQKQVVTEAVTDVRWQEMDQDTLDKSWKQVVAAFRDSVRQERIKAISRQLQQLDQKDDKTDEDEKLQQELLQEIVQLRA